MYVPPPLKVSEHSANETGAVFIEFSKPIFTPEPYQDLETKKLAPDFDAQIDKVLSITLSSSYYDEGRPEIEIAEVILESFD